MIFLDPFQYGVFNDFVILLFCAWLQSIGGAREDKNHRAFISGALPKCLASLQLHGRAWSKSCYPSLQKPSVDCGRHRPAHLKSSCLFFMGKSRYIYYYLQCGSVEKIHHNQCIVVTG